MTREQFLESFIKQIGRGIECELGRRVHPGGMGGELHNRWRQVPLSTLHDLERDCRHVVEASAEQYQAIDLDPNA